MKRSGIEFLLVRTGSGCWTFPKGSTEPGLTRAQSAAMEAFEEAGVHGRIEEASFARYFYRKSRQKRAGPGRKELVVHAHLCEVANAERPRESKRDPKWYSAEKAKRKLREGRSDYDGAELARVIDLAATRVQRILTREDVRADNLKRVKFDVFQVAGTPVPLQLKVIGRYIRREPLKPGDRWHNARLVAQRLLTGKVLPLNGKKGSTS